MNKVEEILVCEEYDGFFIIANINGIDRRFRFNQEDTKEGLVDMFKAMGFDKVSYSEVY